MHLDGKRSHEDVAMEDAESNGSAAVNEKESNGSAAVNDLVTGLRQSNLSDSRSTSRRKYWSHPRPNVNYVISNRSDYMNDRRHSDDPVYNDSFWRNFDENRRTRYFRDTMRREWLNILQFSDDEDDRKWDSYSLESRVSATKDYFDKESLGLKIYFGEHLIYNEIKYRLEEMLDAARLRFDKNIVRSLYNQIITLITPPEK